MMDELDARLAALFASGPDIADEGFTSRVMALAAFDRRAAAARQELRRRWATEAATLAAILALFALLARLAPVSGGVLPVGSPALFAVALLATWVLVGPRGAVSAG